MSQYNSPDALVIPSFWSIHIDATNCITLLRILHRVITRGGSSTTLPSNLTLKSFITRAITMQIHNKYMSDTKYCTCWRINDITCTEYYNMLPLGRSWGLPIEAWHWKLADAGTVSHTAANCFPCALWLAVGLTCHMQPSPSCSDDSCMLP